MSASDEIIHLWIKIQQSSESEVQTPEALGKLNLSQVHCLAVIGDVPGANVTRIASEIEMTTGAITKICKKLLAQGYIDKYQQPSNNKEVYYRLTAAGQEIYISHKRLHVEARRDAEAIIETYTEDEKATILKFLNDVWMMDNHSFIQPQMNSEVSDED